MSILQRFKDAPAAKKSFRVEDPNALDNFSRALQTEIALVENKLIVLICIGTDRSTGDCLGPLVGTKLSDERELPFQVFGTLDNPVHATNLIEHVSNIHTNFSNPFVIAIDACLGNLENIGCVTIGKGSLKPGAGVNKSLPPVGDLHITGIVNVGGFLEYFVLQNTRLNIVMKMATLISKGLINSFSNYKALNR